MSSQDMEQQFTVLESTSTNEGDNVALGRRKRLRKRTTDEPISPKHKQKKQPPSPKSVSNTSARAHMPPPCQPAKQEKTPNIYVRDVTDFKAFSTKIANVAGANNFSCRARFSDIVISTTTSDSYRSVIRYLNTIEANFHCYQLPEDKYYRVVIRHLHYSTPPEDIISELSDRGYTVKKVHNIRHPVTKAQLPLFFVDLEKCEKSRDIFKEKYLNHTAIKVEEPRQKNNLLQCLKCQEYNHSQNYCHHKPRCVKCGDEHASKDCPKKKEAPPTCANCGGNHTANYKGCEVYKALKTIRRRRDRSISRGPRPEQPSTLEPTPGTSNMPPPDPPRTATVRRPSVTYSSLLYSSKKNPSPTPVITPQPQQISPPPTNANIHHPSPLPQRPRPTPRPSPHPPTQGNAAPPSSSTQNLESLMNIFFEKLEALLKPVLSFITNLLSKFLT